jgi:hypothetical protein
LKEDDAAIYHSYAKSAFRGADFHLNRIKKLLNHPLMQHPPESDSIDEETRQKIENSWNAIHWHTRSFFWELVAVFDTLLRWANSRYDLGANSFYDFKWRDDQRKTGFFYATAHNDVDEWADKRKIMDEIWKEEWFQDVRKFRNYAHQGFIPQNVWTENIALGNGKYKPVRVSWVSLPCLPGMKPQYLLDLPSQLTEYLKTMGAEAKKLFDS